VQPIQYIMGPVSNLKVTCNTTKVSLILSEFVAMWFRHFDKASINQWISQEWQPLGATSESLSDKSMTCCSSSALLDVAGLLTAAEHT